MKMKVPSLIVVLVVAAFLGDPVGQRVALAASVQAAESAPRLTADQVAALHKVALWDIEYSFSETWQASGSGAGSRALVGQVRWNLDVGASATYSLKMTVGGADCDSLRFVPPGCVPQLGFPASITESAQGHAHETYTTTDATHPICSDPKGTFRTLTDDTTYTISGTVTEASQLIAGDGAFEINYFTNPPTVMGGPGLRARQAHPVGAINSETCTSGPAQPGLNYSTAIQGAADFFDACPPPLPAIPCHSAHGDTQVRVEQGRFVVRGSVNESWTDANGVCAFACSSADRLFIPGSGSMQAEWVVREHGAPKCEIDEQVVTSPNAGNVFDGMADADGDGIPDECETNGIAVRRFDGTSVTYLLPGADPAHKDLYVEVDYMSGFAPTAHTLQDVGNAFANAPLTVGNPDGRPGVTLHAFLDEEVPHVAGIQFDPGGRGPGANDDFWDIKVDLPSGSEPCPSGFFGTASERSDPHCVQLLAAKRLVFRYAIFGDTHTDLRTGHVTTSEGVAELGGNDFLVTEGGMDATSIALEGGQEAAEAETFMHELGHTLRLHHGGADGTNCKPNYLSVMNYVWTLDPARRLDYSRGELPALDENNLTESRGIGAPAGSRNTVYGAGGLWAATPGSGAIDWNMNGSTTDSGVGQVVRWNDVVPECFPVGTAVDGPFLTIRLNSLLGGTTPPQSAFEVRAVSTTGGAQTVQVTSVRRVYWDTIYLRLATPVDPLATDVSVAYTEPSSGPVLVNLTGQPIASFGPLPVLNIAGFRQVLSGYDDWSNLRFSFRHNPGFAEGHGDLAHPQEEDLTNEDLHAMADRALALAGTTPPSSASPPQMASTLPPALLVANSASCGQVTLTATGVTPALPHQMVVTSSTGGAPFIVNVTADASQKVTTTVDLQKSFGTSVGIFSAFVRMKSNQVTMSNTSTFAVAACAAPTGTPTPASPAGPAATPTPFPTSTPIPRQLGFSQLPSTATSEDTGVPLPALGLVTLFVLRAIASKKRKSSARP